MVKQVSNKTRATFYLEYATVVEQEVDMAALRFSDAIKYCSQRNERVDQSFEYYIPKEVDCGQFIPVCITNTTKLITLLTKEFYEGEDDKINEYVNVLQSLYNQYNIFETRHHYQG